MTADEMRQLEEYVAQQRAQQPACRNCGWYAKATETAGECHRYPPAVPPPGLNDDPWRQAITPAGNVCGEFVHAKTGEGFLDRLRPDHVRALFSRLDDRLSRVERGVAE